AAVSDTAGEWFEIYALTAVDLNGLSIDRAGDTSAPTPLTAPECLHVGAGEYAIFVKNVDSTMNGGLPEDRIRGRFTFSLVDGTAAAPGDVQILSGTAVLDAITWTSTRAGRAHQLDPDRYDVLENDEELNFCDA